MDTFSVRKNIPIQLFFVCCNSRISWTGQRNSSLCGIVWIARPRSLIQMEKPISLACCVLCLPPMLTYSSPWKGQISSCCTPNLIFSSLRQECQCLVGGKWLNSLVVTKYVVILNWKDLCNCKIMYSLLWQ